MIRIHHRHSDALLRIPRRWSDALIRIPRRWSDALIRIPRRWSDALIRIHGGALETRYWLLSTGYWFSESRVVVKPDIPACSLLGRIDHAGVKGPRIDVKRHRALVRFARIHHPVHRLPRIDRAWISRRQLHRVRCEQLALARLDILKSDVKIFDQQFSRRRRHPAILVTMIVHRTALPNVPADGDQFVEVCFVDEVARIVLPVPGP